MPEKTKAMCNGCREDYYNRNTPGGCWCFGTATIVERVRVGIWETPPYHPDRVNKCLSCFRPEGSAMLQLTDSRVRSTPFPT